MNKRIFSLVCIVLYVLLTVSIHCSEQKESGLRSRITRAIKKIKRSNKKNGTETKSKIQLNNNNNKDSIDDKDDCIEYYRNYDKDAPKYVPLCCGLCCEVEDDTGLYTYVLSE
ncbi:fam-c protein [Plasmodium yoelii]|uniref:Fam-c protein n=2 Tax=Plasmodium yoelii TaxID=5861 RepID=A0AAE9WRC4_PLAYO|nr:fam-c protein [Plasmodium yoelii]WBY57636.1 fam-c protein [Plasmodium yoelii yoelii]CDU18238.1 fam-c protein [Plasmodium yoelii]VTZ78655.1 fam-c protein [Plasmodium yoelii]|eukprot:XP_022812302.1 fam-c protein [Plasmodium yoelii]